MAKSLILVYSLHIVLLIIVLIISQNPYFTTSKKVPTGFSMKLISRDSPKSPLYPGNLTETQRLERLVGFSKGRARYLKYSTTTSFYKNDSNKNISPQEAQMELIRLSFYYIVVTSLGNPETDLYLLMDTGGGLIWTQCLPCIKCFAQEVPLYDSTASTSYWKLPCNHFLCNGGPESRYECVNDECVYSVGYGGGSGPTKGIASVETIFFMLSGGQGTQAIDGVVFGCSNDNTNFPDFEHTAISGIMGLSWSPDSLMTQLTDYINNRFSYCIVPFYKDMPQEEGILSFGSAIATPRGNLLSTSFVPRPPGSQNHYFYLNLLDVSVGWVKLGFPEGTFAMEEDGSGGYFIDSGAPMSLLINQDLPSGRNPYKEVIAEFQKFYDSKRLHRRTDVQSLDLCYDEPDGFKDFVTMTYHLEGADYIVDGKNVNFYSRASGYFCVGLAGHEISILGAVHQQDMRLIYDGNSNTLQFTSEDCSVTR